MPIGISALAPARVTSPIHGWRWGWSPPHADLLCNCPRGIRQHVVLKWDLEEHQGIPITSGAKLRHLWFKIHYQRTCPRGVAHAWIRGQNLLTVFTVTCPFPSHRAGVKAVNAHLLNWHPRAHDTNWCPWRHFCIPTVAARESLNAHRILRSHQHILPFSHCKPWIHCRRHDSSDCPFFLAP